MTFAMPVKTRTAAAAIASVLFSSFVLTSIPMRRHVNSSHRRTIRLVDDEEDASTPGTRGWVDDEDAAMTNVTHARPAPVYSFYNGYYRQLTIHMRPAWDTGGGSVEDRHEIAFFAYVEPVDGTVPIKCFWNPYYKQLTFHPGNGFDLWGDTESLFSSTQEENIMFYAFAERAPFTVPVRNFWSPTLGRLVERMGEPAYEHGGAIEEVIQPDDKNCYAACAADLFFAYPADFQSRPSTSLTKPATELVEWIQAMVIYIPRVNLGAMDGKDFILEGVKLSNFSIPYLEFGELQTGHEGLWGFAFDVENIVLDIGIDYMNPSASWGTYEVRDLRAKFVGHFNAFLTLDLRKLDNSTISISECEADANVVISHIIVDSIDADKVRSVMEDQISLTAKSAVCGKPGSPAQSQVKSVTSKLQNWLDRIIQKVHASEDLAPPHVKPIGVPFHWSSSVHLQWFTNFVTYLKVDGLGPYRMIDRLFQGPAGGKTGCCLFGPKDVYSHCPMSVPALTRVYLDPDERPLKITFSDAALLVRNFSVKAFDFPVFNVSAPGTIGFKIDLDAVDLLFTGHMDIESEAFDSYGHIQKNISVNLDVSSFKVDFAVLVEVDDDTYRDIPPEYVWIPACIDAILHQFRVSSFQQHFDVRAIHVSIEPVSAVLSDPETRLVTSLNSLLQNILVGMLNDANPQINFLINAVVKPRFEQFMNTGRFSGLAARFGLYSPLCPAYNLVSDPAFTVSWSQTRWILAWGLLIVGFVHAIFASWVGPTQDPSHPALNPEFGKHPAFRLLVPCWIVASFVLYIESSLNGGASMKLYLTLESQVAFNVPLLTLRRFSVFQTIHQLWTSNVKALAILITLFSVVIPYAKLVTCLLVWQFGYFRTRRTAILKYLHLFGKWSLLDVYVVVAVICIVSMNVRFKGGSGVAMYVEPMWGFMAFILATCVTMLTGTLIIANNEMDPSLYVGRLPKESEPISFRLRVVLFVCFLFGIVVLVAAALKNVFAITIDGLIGWVLNSCSLRGNNVFVFSLHNVWLRIFQVAGGASPVFADIVMSTYLMFAVLLPIVFLVVAGLMAVRLCVGPWWNKLVRELYAWSALDCLMLGLTVSILEMSDGGHQIIDTPASVEIFMREYVSPRFDIPGHVNGVAALKPWFASGFRFMVFGAIIQTVVGLLFLDLLEREEEHKPIDILRPLLETKKKPIFGTRSESAPGNLSLSAGVEGF